MALSEVHLDDYGPSFQQIEDSKQLVEGAVETLEGRVSYWARTTPSAKTKVILVPGLGCPWFLMAPLSSLLAGESVILCLPGTSRTELPRSGYTVDGLRRMLEQACASLELEPACVVGHSLGAVMASSLIHDSSWAVDNLILVCPPGDTISGLLKHEKSGTGITSRTQAALGLVGMVVSGHIPSSISRALLASLPGVNPTLRYCFAAPSRLRRSDLRRLIQTMVKAPVVQTLEQARRTDTDRILKLGQAKRQTAIFGTHDRLVPPEDATAFAGRNGSWNTILASPAGHWLPFEHPDYIATLMSAR